MCLKNKLCHVVHTQNLNCRNTTPIFLSVDVGSSYSVKLPHGSSMSNPHPTLKYPSGYFKLK